MKAPSRGRSRGLLEALVRCALAGSVLVACAAPEPVDLVVRGATVVDVASGELLADRAVVVRDGLIEGVVPAAEVSGYEAATVIDSGGGYLTPALADAHVHLQSASELDSYLLHGIGPVVNMSGAPRHLELRRAITEGRRRGPRIVTVGPTLDGLSPTNPLFTSVTPETAPEIVAWIADRGYDAIKVYQQIDAESLSAVIRAAESAGLITTGHVSRIAGVEGAVRVGLRYVAHGEELAFEAFDEETRRFDRGAIPRLVELLSSQGVTVTPMIGYLEQVPPQVLALDDYLGSGPMGLVPAAMKLSFGPRQAGSRIATSPPPSPIRWRTWPASWPSSRRRSTRAACR